MSFSIILPQSIEVNGASIDEIVGCYAHGESLYPTHERHRYAWKVSNDLRVYVYSKTSLSGADTYIGQSIKHGDDIFGELIEVDRVHDKNRIFDAFNVYKYSIYMDNLTINGFSPRDSHIESMWWLTFHGNKLVKISEEDSLDESMSFDITEEVMRQWYYSNLTAQII